MRLAWARRQPGFQPRGTVPEAFLLAWAAGPSNLHEQSIGATKHGTGNAISPTTP